MSPGRLGFGFKVGHWTDEAARTGCTVVLPPAGNVASCEIRGSSPGSRELEQLHPDRRLTEVHAILLTGGSAFGLAAATGVVDFLERRGIGYDTSVAKVPIVPAAVIFDLGAGRADVRPGPDEGRAACGAATEDPVATGRVGAGTGATVGKWRGLDHAAVGGLGVAVVEQDGLQIAALAVANAVGDVVAADGSVLAGSTAPDNGRGRFFPEEQGPPMNTVLALVAMRAKIGKRDARWLAARGTDGITTSVRPAHTRYDGDVVFAVAAPDSSGGEPDLDALGVLATQAVAEAVRNAVV
ncbi:MAG: P1 family peptidase [Actinomycetota bacterium]